MGARYELGQLFPPFVRDQLDLTPEQEKQVAELEAMVKQRLDKMLTADQNPETVIRSINEGEVYRFICKPWDNTSLRTMVHFAFEVVLLEEENRQLLAIVRRQRAELRQMRPTPDAEAEMILAEAELFER